MEKQFPLDDTILVEEMDVTKPYFNNPFKTHRKQQSSNLVFKYMLNNQTTDIYPRRSQIERVKGRFDETPIANRPAERPSKLKQLKQTKQLKSPVQQKQVRPSRNYQRMETEQDNYYLYWKNKALEYQNENFGLLTQNALLKQELQTIKKNNHTKNEIQMYHQMMERNYTLQRQIENMKLSEKQLIQKINMLQNTINQNTLFVQQLIDTKQTNNRYSVNKNVIEHNQYLEEENIRYREKIRELHQQLGKKLESGKILKLSQRNRERIDLNMKTQNHKQ